MRKLFFLILSVSFLFSCFTKEQEEILATVNEKDLSLKEVISAMPSQIEDSAYFVEEYLNRWIRKQLMIYQAEINLKNRYIKFGDIEINFLPEHLIT